MPAAYFLGSRLLGVAKHKYWSDTQFCTESWVLVCPQCGDAWGRVVDNPANWVPVRSPCPKHSGGSFLFPWLTTLDGLPLEVLRHEALRLINQQDSHEPPLPR